MKVGPLSKTWSRRDSGRPVTVTSCLEMHAQAMPPAHHEPRRERPERTAAGAGISAVSLFVSQPDRFEARSCSVQPARAGIEANRHEAHKKVAATRWHDLGRVGTGGA